MTLRDISSKLFIKNRKQYLLFFFSITFAISMTGAYGVLQYSPAVTNVLADGGSTQIISRAMFYGCLLGITLFLVYANSLYLKYKSREIGIFLSLGIDRPHVQKIVVREFTLLFQTAALLGLLLSIPIAYASWSLLNVFLGTTETGFLIGWKGVLTALCFAVTVWLLLRCLNRSYIRRLDIVHILKAENITETSKDGNLILLLFSCILIPAGIAAFFLLQSKDGLNYTCLALLSLVAAAYGIHLLILQSASVGDILKKHRPNAYYKNLVFFHLLKHRIRQYTRSIFTAALLITFTIFGIGFIAAGFIDGYMTALNEPYDYTINVTAEHSELTSDAIYHMASECNTTIQSMKYLDCLLMGVQNSYRDGSTDWGSRIVVSAAQFTSITGIPAVIPQGSYSLYYDSRMSYKQNAFTNDETKFYQPTTHQMFLLKQNDPIICDELFNSRSFYSSFLILNDKEFEALSLSLGPEYKVRAYMLNVTGWKHSQAFQTAILRAVISDQIFTNWHNSAVFELTGTKAQYLPYQGNETRIARVWALYPLSKLSSTSTQFEAFATYLMLMLFIAILAFFSAIMIIGLKLISTIWDDTAVYEAIHRLGMTNHSIRQLITKQMMFICFIPTILGCLVGAFTAYRIMLAAGVRYIAPTMQLVGGVCVLVFLINLIFFYLLQLRIIRRL